MNMNPDQLFSKVAHELGYSFEDEIKIGGNYTSIVEHGNEVYVSGQIPRIGDKVIVTGRAGSMVDISQAQLAAKVCAMRALALLRQHLTTLNRIEKILRVTVYVQSAENFTQQSEVANGASDVLFAVLGQAGAHTRTSVGVYQLPKNATVELDLIASIR